MAKPNGHRATLKRQTITLADFQFLMVIGRGAFGKVYLAKLKDEDQLYAVKAIRKDILLQYDQVDSTELEKNIMLESDHPFIVGMDYSFMDDLHIYFIRPFVRGAELYKVFLKKKRFPENVVKFYAVQLIMAIGYLHSKGIIHRDMKLENILLEDDGYIKLVDFGIAKRLQQD